MSAPDQPKEARVQQAAGRRYGKLREPYAYATRAPSRFLELDSRWVDALLEAEGKRRIAMDGAT